IPASPLCQYTEIAGKFLSEKAAKKYSLLQSFRCRRTLSAGSGLSLLVRFATCGVSGLALVPAGVAACCFILFMGKNLIYTFSLITYSKVSYFIEEILR